jgi:hypothetical protein
MPIEVYVAVGMLLTVGIILSVKFILEWINLEADRRIFNMNSENVPPTIAYPTRDKEDDYRRNLYRNEESIPAIFLPPIDTYDSPTSSGIPDREYIDSIVKSDDDHNSSVKFGGGDFRGSGAVSSYESNDSSSYDSGTSDSSSSDCGSSDSSSSD